MAVTFHNLVAQPSDSLNQNKSKFYIGLGLSTNYYALYYKNRSTDPKYSNNFVARPYLNIGYQLNKRISLQVGIAYATKKVHDYDIYYGAGTNTIERHFYDNTKAIVMPFTLRFVFFNINGKLPIYGTAAVIPAYARSELKRTEGSNNITITTFHGQASGLNAFFTAGLGFRYTIRKRFSGYAEVIMYNRNMTGDNVDPFRFEKFGVFRHSGLGFNYNL